MYVTGHILVPQLDKKKGKKTYTRCLQTSFYSSYVSWNQNKIQKILTSATPFEVPKTNVRYEKCIQTTHYTNALKQEAKTDTNQDVPAAAKKEHNWFIAKTNAC